MIGTTTVLISPVYSPTRGIAEEPGLPEMADNCKTGAREWSSITGTCTLARPVKAYRAIARSPRDPLITSYLLSHDAGKEFPSSSIHRPDTSRQPRCARRSDDTDARSGVASGPLAVGSAPMLPHLFADERLSPSARERIRNDDRAGVARDLRPPDSIKSGAVGDAISKKSPARGRITGAGRASVSIGWRR